MASFTININNNDMNTMRSAVEFDAISKNVIASGTQFNNAEALDYLKSVCIIFLRQLSITQKQEAAFGPARSNSKSEANALDIT